MTTPTERGLRRWAYGALSLGLLVGYVLGTLVAWPLRGVDESGPLRESAPELTSDAPGAAVSLSQVRTACRNIPSVSSEDEPDQRIKVVSGTVDGQLLFGCYGYQPSDADEVLGAAVLDRTAEQVRDVDLIQASGAWRSIGLVKTPGEVLLGGIGVAVVLFIWWQYWRVPRPLPPSPRWRRVSAAILSFIPCLGWLIGLWLAGRGRRGMFGAQIAVRWAWISFGSMILYWVDGPLDGFGAMVLSLFGLALLWGWLGGRRLVERRENVLMAGSWSGPPGQPGGWAQQPYPPPAGGQYGPYGPQYSGPVAAEPAKPADQAKQDSIAAAGFRVRKPGELPTFAQVGGMAELKHELESTLGLVLAYTTEAEQYRIEYNGILLHGKPGVGKTFIAQAAAGEFGLSFIHVTTGDLVSSFTGQAAKNVDRAFAAAAANLPCLLFFDEFDSVAARREDQPSEESRRVVNQLLTSLEQFRDVGELIVMAATNHLEQLDTAVIRPGRFDRHVRVDLPDAAAREAILHVLLDRRPTADLTLADMVRRTEGMTPATLQAVVDAAALSALQQTVERGTPVPITSAHLVAALEARGGKDRPHVAGHDWDDVILAEPVKKELQQLQRLVEDPELAARYGVDPPSGLLLTGPPGTGKTTLARVLAAQTKCSFYVVSPADVTSKWVGESEKRIQQLFERARNNAPAIVFLDEVDALAGTRGELGSTGVDTAMLTQLLTQLDGLEERGRVFVIGATNRPEAVDPALLRPGRLSRMLEIPLPDQPGRQRLLELFSANMTLAGVHLAELAAQTEGWSGADLEGLCQQAAVHAMLTATPGEPAQVGRADFTSALATLHASRDRLDAARDASPSLNDHLNALTRPDPKG